MFITFYDKDAFIRPKGWPKGRPKAWPSASQVQLRPGSFSAPPAYIQKIVFVSAKSIKITFQGPGTSPSCPGRATFVRQSNNEPKRLKFR